MNRLTNKRLADASKNGYFIEIKKEVNIKHCSVTQLYEKLAKYEDLEEELGIDLITLFKALKGEIYSIHPKTRKICPIILPIFYYCGNQWIIGCHSMEWNAEENSCDNWDCFLKDYGKTWSLVKENLEQ